MIITEYHQRKLDEWDKSRAQEPKQLIKPDKIPSTEQIIDDIVDRYEKSYSGQGDYTLNPNADIPLNKILTDIEVFCLTFALNKCSGNKTQAAKMLGLNRTTLVEKLRKYCLEAEDFDLEPKVPRDFRKLFPVEFDPSKTNFLVELQWLKL